MNRFFLFVLALSLLIIICTSADGKPSASTSKPSGSKSATKKPSKPPVNKGTMSASKPDPAELRM